MKGFFHIHVVSYKQNRNIWVSEFTEFKNNINHRHYCRIIFILHTKMSQIRHKYIDGLQKRIYYGYIKLLDNKKTLGMI